MVWVTQCIGYICLCFIYAINQTTIKTETRGQWVASLIWSPIANVQNSHQTKDDIPKHWPLFYVELQKNLSYFLDPLTVKFYVVCVTLFLQRIKKKWIKWAGPRTKEDMHTEKLKQNTTRKRHCLQYVPSIAATYTTPIQDTCLPNKPISTSFIAVFLACDEIINLFSPFFKHGEYK